jgi:hypothetical protein
MIFGALIVLLVWVSELADRVTMKRDANCARNTGMAGAEGSSAGDRHRHRPLLCRQYRFRRLL